MTRLLICAPLHLEAAALRLGAHNAARARAARATAVRADAVRADAARADADCADRVSATRASADRASIAGAEAGCAEVAVVRTGMGPNRDLRPAARLAADAVAVAGVCGGLDARMRPGDVVVATELRRGDSVTPCPSAEWLAAEFRDAGFTVRTGPIITVDRPVHGAARARLAATGAVAVDMESAALAAVAAGRPLAVVRSVVDTPDRPLFGLATLTGGITALATLRRVVPVLARWAVVHSTRSKGVR